MKAQPQIVTRGQHRVHTGGKVRQQPGELPEGLRRVQLVQIIDHQRNADASTGQLRQHPVDHRRRIEIRCRCWRFGAAGRAGGMPDRVEQGQPEVLGVVLVAAHLHDGEPVRPVRTVGPGAQQRRLPAACRCGDDRDLPRRRAIQGSEKITPVDQPGGCPGHRQGPALVSTPDTLTRVTQYWHLPSRRHDPCRPGCPGLANHQNPVRSSHLSGGQPGSVAKGSYGRAGTVPKTQREMTS